MNNIEKETCAIIAVTLALLVVCTALQVAVR